MNVVVVDGHIIIAIGAALLVIETKCVQEFVDGRSSFASGSCAAETAGVQGKSLWLQKTWAHANVAVAPFVSHLEKESDKRLRKDDWDVVMGTYPPPVFSTDT